MHLTIVLVFIIVSAECLRAAGPILIVPGLIGSPLLAKVHSHGLCSTHGMKYVYWIGLADYLQPYCIPKVLTLKYDNSHYYNNTGVEVEPYKFGDADSVKYIDPHLKKIKYFLDFIEYFDNRDYDVRAAPYDWRLAADELDRIRYYEKVKNLIEDMYYDNNGQKVTVVAHSMGGPVSLYFFNNVVTQEWKDQYIHAYIPLAGAWTGGNAALAVSLSGLKAMCQKGQDSFLCDIGKALEIFGFDEAVYSLESLQWMLPNPAVWGNEVLVTVERQEYTAYDQVTLFQLFGRDQQFIERFQGIFSINKIFNGPNVPTYCYYGMIKDSTPEKFIYEDGVKKLPTIVKGDGDNTVNRKGSEVCLEWEYTQTAPFSHEVFDGVTHKNIVIDESVLKSIESAIQQQQTAYQYYA